MNPSRPACPFITKGKIEDPLGFIGRKEELRQLTNWMSGSQPISVNVVGERLSGKSSLLWHFTNTWAQRGPDPARFFVVYICLRLAKPKTEAEFYQILSAALHDKLPDVPALSSGREFKKEILDKLAGQGLLPVFCLDEFEKLFDHKDELKKDFYDGLHSLTNTNRMMLIIATRRPVEIIAGEHQLLSAFFNFGQLCKLKDFRDEEAEELVNLPDRNNPALDAADRRLARKWGNRHPYLLQLAGQVLFEAKRDDKDHAWAKKKFTEQRKRMQKSRLLSVKAIGQCYRSVLGVMAEDAEKWKKILVTLAMIVGLLTAALEWLLK
jgi:AAA+ ATPase superfamily predicted ATPase